jgi:hypothetical protein
MESYALNAPAGYSNSELVTLAIVPKFSASLSLIASIWILLEVGGHKSKRSLVYHRMLFAFAFIDVIVSGGIFLTTWPMPADTVNSVFSVGNTATCNFQGFLLQMSSALPIYNAVLAVYYMLTIRYNVSENIIKKKYELYFHVVPIGFSIGSSTAALLMGMFNEASLWCWIAAYPYGCLQSGQTEDGTTTCTRGNGAYFWRLAIYYVPLWIMFGVVLVTLFLVWRGVKTQEDRAARFNPVRRHASRHSNRESPQRPSMSSSSNFRAVRQLRRSVTALSILAQTPRSWQVFSQCLFYVAAFYLAHFFATIDRIYQQVTGTAPFWLLLAHSIFQPLQGFFNLIVYRRPQYVRLRLKYPNKRRIWIIKKCLRSQNMHHML